MDKELLEMFNKLKNIMADNVKDSISEAFNEPAKISIEKDADGRAKTHIEGKPLPILIALAGLEKAVLEKLDAPTGVWELIKEAVGTKEVE